MVYNLTIEIKEETTMNMKNQESISNIGCKWKFVGDTDILGLHEYILLDVHQNNFHSSVRQSECPKVCKIMWGKNDRRYILYNKKAWYID